MRTRQKASDSNASRNLYQNIQRIVKNQHALFPSFTY